jgi:parvulin-like peptidyl-prolyl isomerase
MTLQPPSKYLQVLGGRLERDTPRIKIDIPENSLNTSRFINIKGRSLRSLSLGTAALAVLTGGLVAGCAKDPTAEAVATVGSENITRGQLYSFLEANSGEQGLRQLIDYSLVMQEAQSKGVTVTDEEVKAELDRRKATNPAIAEAEKRGGAAVEALQRQVRLQLALDRLMTREIKEDPKKIEEWFKKNRARYDQSAKVKLGVLFTSQKARADVLAQGLKNGKSFLELVNEQKKANDPVAQGSTNDTSEAGPSGQPGPGYIPVAELPPDMKGAVEKLKPNETSGVVKLAGASPAFAIIKLLDRQEAVTAKATDANVVNEWKLEQVARGIVKENPQNPDFDKTVQQVEQFVQQQEMQQGRMTRPSFRQVLDFINQTAVQKMLTDLRPKANIAIADPQYAKIGDDYKPVPTPAAAAGGASGAPASGAPAGGAASGGAASGGTASSAPAKP